VAKLGQHPDFNRIHSEFDVLDGGDDRSIEFKEERCLKNGLVKPMEEEQMLFEVGLLRGIVFRWNSEKLEVLLF
jgi:hypothetical protein